MSYAQLLETINRLGAIQIYDEDKVKHALRGLESREDFMILDTQPGRWNYKDSHGREWHWLLRRFRNSPAFKAWFFKLRG